MTERYTYLTGASPSSISPLMKVAMLWVAALMSLALPALAGEVTADDRRREDA